MRVFWLAMVKFRLNEIMDCETNEKKGKKAVEKREADVPWQKHPSRSAPPPIPRPVTAFFAFRLLIRGGRGAETVEKFVELVHCGAAGRRLGCNHLRFSLPFSDFVG